MIVVGSRAKNVCYPQAKIIPNDFDYICTYDRFQEWVSNRYHAITRCVPTKDGRYMHAIFGGSHYEFEIAWPGSTAEKILYMSNGHFVRPEIQLMMKLSHRYLKNSPHFLKTMNDIWFFRNKGIVLTPELQNILKLREKETYTYSHPKLDKTKKTFFDESVPYIYNHDDIHVAVAVGSEPAYKGFSVDGQEVLSSKERFFKMKLMDQLRAGLEESYVLAIERSLVPFPGVKTPREAFLMALEKVCTSITSGWFREYCWEDYHTILHLYEDDYFEKFKVALENGRIRNHIE